MRAIPTIDDIIEVLMPAWTAVLGVGVSPDSDFIALGGNSLSAVYVADVVAQRYGVYDGLDVIAVQAAFETGTLRAMASTLATFMQDQSAR